VSEVGSATYDMHNMNKISFKEVMDFINFVEAHDDAFNDILKKYGLNPTLSVRQRAMSEETPELKSSLGLQLVPFMPMPLIHRRLKEKIHSEVVAAGTRNCNQFFAKENTAAFTDPERRLMAFQYDIVDGDDEKLCFSQAPATLLQYLRLSWLETIIPNTNDKELQAIVMVAAGTAIAKLAKRYRKYVKFIVDCWEDVGSERGNLGELTNQLHPLQCTPIMPHVHPAQSPQTHNPRPLLYSARARQADAYCRAFMRRGVGLRPDDGGLPGTFHR